MNEVTLMQGDCLEVLRTMPSNSVQMCVTSPAYWGLRDYGIDGQIGLESTPAEYVAKLVAVFNEVHRVLKDNGTLWLNLGDSYNSAPVGRFSGGGFKDKSAQNGTRDFSGVITSGQLNKLAASGLPPKNRMGIPHRVVFALQDAGWIWRDEIVWQKPAIMPESVTDRTSKSHEFIFLLAKNAEYFYDAAAIAEPSRNQNETRNKRSVWTVATQPYSGAHFAVFPPKLVEPCILAGSKVGDTVLDCFSGSGTTGAVAVEHGRDYIGIELNPAYIELARTRIDTAQLQNRMELAYA